MCLDHPLKAGKLQEMTVKAVRWLVQNQNSDGGWSAAKGLASSVEETGLAVEALSSLNFFGIDGVKNAIDLGSSW